MVNMEAVWCVPIVLSLFGDFCLALDGSIEAAKEAVDTCDALFLTPYIESGRLEEGRRLSTVQPFLENVVSYSGYLTVNKTTESHLFFWFFPCEKNPDKAPVGLWLQGGPGATSMFGALNENGPFEMRNSTLARRPHYWTEIMSMIYLDQPVGTGFSFTKKEGYANNEEEVARDVYHALQQFFDLFPEFRDNDFFVSGESYGGKYVPSVAYGIHQYNPSYEKKINLKGVAIGNGMVDVLNMLNLSNILFEEGFIDIQTRERFAAIEEEAIHLVHKKDYMKAWWLLDEYFYGDLSNSTLLTNVTGIYWYYNILIADRKDMLGNDSDWLTFINAPETRKALHVGNCARDLIVNNEVAKHLMLDRFVSTAPKLEVLIDSGYRVLLYNGQLDIVCAYPLTANYVSKMQWNGKEEFDEATNKKWFVGKDLAGYVKTSGNVAMVMVRNAGHMVPTDQPVWALDLITRFTRGQPLDNFPSQ